MEYMDDFTPEQNELWEQFVSNGVNTVNLFLYLRNSELCMALADVASTLRQCRPGGNDTYVAPDSATPFAVFFASAIFGSIMDRRNISAYEDGWQEAQTLSSITDIEREVGYGMLKYGPYGETPDAYDMGKLDFLLLQRF